MEELTEKEFEDFDAFIEALRGEIAELERFPRIIDPKRLEDIEAVYNIVKYLTRDCIGTTVTCNISDGVPGYASIELIANKFEFNEPYLISRAAVIADNYEVYPRVDGTICIAFMFNNTSRILK